jgi:hypothetical protein
MNPRFIDGGQQRILLLQTLMPTTIADSYTWFANEVYWTAKCRRFFIMALTGDDYDPLCNNNQCTGCEELRPKRVS